MKNDIAVIGMAGRFPGADSIETLLQNLKDGVDSVSEVTEKRIKEATHDPARPFRKMGYMDDIDKFDHEYFRISLNEAQMMDPVFRLLLEVAHETIESAGYHVQKIGQTKTSVFVADINPEYYTMANEFTDVMVSGNSPAFLAARIARQFGLKGNAMMIDTACSSSLVALHVACNALILGETEAALVCGANINLYPYKDKAMEFNLWSGDDKSRAFSEEADGMSCGETAVCLLLKPVEKALRDGDVIHAVIKGSAVNNNANRSASPSAPDSISQAAVLKAAWEKSGINPQHISYIEAHGSGTKLGDSLEIEALNNALSAYDVPRKSVAISTIKSNIGHCYNAAGLVGLIKVILSLKHRLLFPNINFETPNKMINFADSAVYVNTALTDWRPADHIPRIAGITSLGASGTNCHIVLEEAPEVQGHGKDSQQMIFLSSQTEEGLRENAGALVERLTSSNDPLMHIAFTLNANRLHHDYRWTCVANTKKELMRQLVEMRETSKDIYFSKESSVKVIYIFSAAEWENTHAFEMLYEQYPIFREAYDQCMDGGKHEPNAFAFQYSLYCLLQHWQIRSTNVLSIGAGDLVADSIAHPENLRDNLNTWNHRNQADHIANIETRVNHLLKREAMNDQVVFLHMNPACPLALEIAKQGGTYGNVQNIAWQNVQDTPILYVFKALQVAFLSGMAVEVTMLYPPDAAKAYMPGYKFRKTRCWCREDAYIENRSAAPLDDMQMKKLPEDGTSLEKNIIKVWAGLLKTNEIRYTDNFFALGGDSLIATQVIGQLEEMYHVKLGFEDIFDFPTVRLLAKYIASQLATEDIILSIWREVLKKPDVSLSDDFFALGGHSLMANQVLVRIQNQLGYNLNFEDIFRYPTPISLSEYIKQLESKGQFLQEQKIQAIPPQDFYETTHAQKRMWILSQFREGSVSYNCPFYVKLNGDLDPEAFGSAFSLLAERHEALRTAVMLVDGKIKSSILPAYAEGRLLDFCRCETAVSESDVREDMGQDMVQPFVLESGYLFRSKLYCMQDHTYIFYINMHHIITDGWSMSVIFHDLALLYHAVKNGGDMPAPLDIQYKDYTVWQKQLYQGNRKESMEQYWQKQFAGDIPVLNLPLDKERPAVKTYNGATLRFTYTDTQHQIKQICRQNEWSLFMVLFGCVNLLLYKYSNQSDIVIGTPVAGRQHPMVENQVGLYVNTLALRTRFDPNQSIRELVEQGKQIILQGLQHQDFPFDQLFSLLSLNRDTSRSGLFDVMMVLQNAKDHTPISAVRLDGMTITEMGDMNVNSMFDLHLEFVENEDEINMNITYNTDLFYQETVSHLGKQLAYLLECIPGILEEPVLSYNINTAAEWEKLVYGWNDTQKEYPYDKTLTHFLKDQAAAIPDAVAIICKRKTMTYAELDFYSDNVASWILAENALGEKGNVIAIAAERSFDMMIGIYAILKAGAAYLPIDPSYPAERIQYMLQDSGACLVCATDAFASLRDIPVMKIGEYMHAMSPGYRMVENEPEDIAYVIYTSGSTGNPKGVQIKHHSIINRIHWMQNKYPLTAQDVIMQKTIFTFDVSVWELFWWAMAGCSVCFLPQGDEKDPAAIISCVQENKVTVMHFVPSMLNAFLDYLSGYQAAEDLVGLKRVFCSGEALTEHHVQKFKELLYKPYGTQLSNLYGPTEATVDVTYFDCFGEETYRTVPIGKPIDNTQIYILDERQGVCPVGVRGEIYISGEGLAAGYLFNDDLTAERFVNNIFIRDARMYKTGDYGRWLPDGNIEYLGRIDQQAKINGQRIELEEIEAKLMAYDGISEVVVNLDHPGEKQQCLTAYCVIEGEAKARQIKQYLISKLPHYMVPQKIIFLPMLPKTTSGKIDRKILSSIGQDHGMPNEPEMEWTSLQRRLKQIWQSVLGVEILSVQDNFFDLGGDSIKALQVAIEAHKEGIEIELKDLFYYPTISAMEAFYQHSNAGGVMNESARIEVQNEVDAVTKEVLAADLRGDLADAYPMSDIETGLLFHSELSEEDGVHYVQFIYPLYIENLRKDLLLQAFALMTEKHENLRAAFDLGSFKCPVKLIYKQVDIAVTWEDISHLHAGEIKHHIQVFLQLDQRVGFSFGQVPLWKSKIFQCDENQYIMVFIFHQAIMDGWSNANFLLEINEIYRKLLRNQSYVPTALKSGYKDFVIEQRIEKQNEAGLQFWKQQLENMKKVTFIPEGGRGKTHRKSYYHQLSSSGCQYLQQIMERFSMGIKDLFFMLYTDIIYHICHSEDFVVAILAHNRPKQADGEKLIGYFLNMVPVRIRYMNDWIAYSTQIKNQLVQIKQYEKIPFSVISQLIGDDVSSGFHITDTLFNYTDFAESRRADQVESTQSDYQELIEESNVQTNTAFDLNIDKVFDSIRIQIDTGLFGADTIAAIFSYIELLLAGLSQENIPKRDDCRLDLYQIPTGEDDLLFDFDF